MDEFIADAIKLFLVVLLVLLNGFFVAAEFAVVKIRSSRIETLINEGNTRAHYAKKLTDHLDVSLSVTQLGITLASLGLGWLGEPTVSRLLEPVFEYLGLGGALATTISFAIAFALITAMHIIAGELIPKNIAIQKAESVMLTIAMPLLFFQKIMYPSVWLLNHVANWTAAALGIHMESEQEDTAHTEDEIRILMEESHKHGYIDKTELDFVDNVFDFADRSVREIMIPRTDMVCLYLEDSIDENMNLAMTERMTRYPVCREDKDDIIGFLHIKDLLRDLNAGQKPDLRSLARDVLLVPESLPISKLLKMLQKHRSQLAVLIDEYGGTAGMVTVEDILEEIVGEIQDEFDEERPEVEDKGNKTYSVDGKMLLDDVNDVFELQLDTENCDTIGGWLYAQIDYPPKVGQKVKTSEAEFTIEEIAKMRITRVKIQLIHEPENIHEEIKEDYMDTLE